jgi:dienelactone hydrolase
MNRIAAFAASILLAFTTAATAQQAPGQHPPLVLNGDTVAVVRNDNAGTLTLPKGPPPFPAVILMHGCGGVTQNMNVWAQRLRSWGYAALILDSFAPRGIDTVCGKGNQFPPRERARDAFAAAVWLRQRPEIDPARIGLIGFSHGGSTALAASVKRRVAALNAEPFKAVVAYYPFCPEITLELASDVQILIGSDDDWTPADRCTKWLPHYGEVSVHRPLLKIYPGAVHAFDARAPSRIYFGHRLEFAAGAARDSFEVTRQFLGSRLLGDTGRE